MSRLLFRYSQETREAVLNSLRRSLEKQPKVLFAYAHGSFLENRPFHDVDVGVYLDPVELDERDMNLYALDLALDLERSLRYPPMMRHTDGRAPLPPLDVRALNRAPLGFCYQVCRGQLLFSRDETLRTQWVERIVCRYLDLRPLQRRALKEAMTA